MSPATSDDGPGTREGSPTPLPRPVERFLLPGDRSVVRTRFHPIVLARPVLTMFGSWIAAVALTAPLPRGSGGADLIFTVALGVTGWAGWKFAQWSVDRFVVTNARVLMATGLLTRKVAMMPLRKVTDMTFEKPLPGRLLGYGTFIMESAGQDQALREIRYLPSPDRHYKAVSELLFGPRLIGSSHRSESDSSRRRAASAAADRNDDDD